MSKPTIEKTQQTAPTVEKEESGDDDESSNDETSTDSVVAPSQSSPSGTLSSVSQPSSLPTDPKTPLTVLATRAANDGAPEASPNTSTSPPPPAPPLTIITADDEISSTSKPVSDTKDQNKEDDATRISSLKLFKNTPGKPNESIFETKHPNFYALDKDYLTRLIQSKARYDRLVKAHKECLPEDERKERDKKLKQREKELTRKIYRYLCQKRHQKLWRRAHRNQVQREDRIRGKCWIDSLEEDERYGPNDPMKYTYKRLVTTNLRNSRRLRRCEAAMKREMEEVTKNRFKIMGMKVFLEKYIETEGQKWLGMFPLGGLIRMSAERTRFTLVNFTDRPLEIKMRITGGENFKLVTKPEIIKPLSYEHVQLKFIKKCQMHQADERFTVYFNDAEDMRKMRKEFGKNAIDITRHYAGRVTVAVFIENWQGKVQQQPNKLDTDVLKAGLRAKSNLEQAKTDINFNYVEPRKSSSEEIKKKNQRAPIDGPRFDKKKFEEDYKKYAENWKKNLELDKKKSSPAVDPDVSSQPSTSSEKRKEKEKKKEKAKKTEKEEEKQKKKAEKEEERKKRRSKSGGGGNRIKADKNLSVSKDVGEEQSKNASVSRETSKESRKTKK